MWGRALTLFFYLQMDIQLPQYFFPHWIVGTLIKNILTINLRIYFWTLNIFSWSATPHCHDYCSFVINFEIGKYVSSLCTFTRLFFPILCRLQFCMNFRISLSTFVLKSQLEFWQGSSRICSSVQGMLLSKQYCVLIHEHRMSFGLFRSLISTMFGSF